MAELIRMPQFTDTMTEAAIDKWLVKKGDKVNQGDVLAEIDLDAVIIELESFDEGVVLFVAAEEGQIIPIDGLLTVIGEEGEDISELLYEIVPVKKALSKRGTTSKTSFNVNKAIISEGVELIAMPKLSDTMMKGEVSEWHKKVGDTIKAGDALADIETDKAILELESFYDGTLLYRAVEKGQIALVGSLLAIIGPAGTNVSEIVKQVKESY